MLNQPHFSSLFFNTCFDKNQLKNLIAWILKTYGEKKTVDFLEKLKQVGFHEATQAGVSLGLEDLKIPTEKAGLIAQSLVETSQITAKNIAGNTTGVEKSQELIDIWNQMSEDLRQNAVQNFRNTNPVNPVFMMAFSGARGNISQVRQLVAMRGLMADPQGAILEFPIQSNFREGLTITEYLISCYGARKGLVDTALRTATSGYLTRRLVDAVQHIVVTVHDCQTSKGIFITNNLRSRLPGRVLAEPLFFENKKLYKKNQLISLNLAKVIASHYTKVLIRSPLTCKAEKSICQLCYGVDLAHGILVNIGEAVGVIAAQSIGEPGTQLTMRTFHTGGVGVFGDQATKALTSPFQGIVQFPEELIGQFVRTPHGNVVYMVKYLPTGLNRIVLKIKPLDKSQPLYVIHEKQLPPGSILLARQNEHVRTGQLVAQASQIKTSKQQMPESIHPVKSPMDGEIFFESMLVIREYPIPDESKKQKIQEPEVSPVIPFLGDIGNFWVFSCFNQRESNSFKPFVCAGDLVSTESFLCQYQFHFSEKVQVKRSSFACLDSSKIHSKIIVGQPFLQFFPHGIHFYQYGYALFTQVTEKEKNKEKDRIFYLKNSTDFSTRGKFTTKTQNFLWFPFLTSKKKVSVLRRFKSQLELSYFFISKNYSLKHYFHYLECAKIDSAHTPTVVARTSNFFINSGRVKVAQLNFFFSSKQNASTLFTQVAFRPLFIFNWNKFKVLQTQTIQHRVLENKQIPEAVYWKDDTFLFHFVFKQVLFQAESEFFFKKTKNFKRKFQLETKNISFNKTKTNNFLTKTLTNKKFLLFENSEKRSHSVFELPMNWIYLASQNSQERKSKKSVTIATRRNFSKFIFLEQGKKFDNFVISNASLSLKMVPSSKLKIFPSFSFFDTSKKRSGFGFSKKDDKGFQNKKDFETSLTFLKQNSNQVVKQNKTGENKKDQNLWYSVKNLQQFPVNFSNYSILSFGTAFSTSFSQNIKIKSQENSSFLCSYQNYSNKCYSILSFYSRNPNFISTKITKRIISKYKQNKSLFCPRSFVFMTKFKEQHFPHLNQLKDRWGRLHFNTEFFNINSPLSSKQTRTIFAIKKFSTLKLKPLFLQTSGWRSEKQNFRVTIRIASNSKFLYAQPSFTWIKKTNFGMFPVNFFSLFFYDFLFFETTYKFNFKTFSNNWLLPHENFVEGFLKIKTPGEIRRSLESENKVVSSILKKQHLMKVNLLDLKLESKHLKNICIGTIIRWGQELYLSRGSSMNGRIINVKQNTLTVRLGVPLLASSRGILHITHNDLVQKNELLVTLKSRRLQTEDIVQGIPKIEQLFEARETQGGEILSNNVHILLESYFIQAWKKVPREIAVSQSISKIQRFLIKNILDAYSNQGVKISEKHVEIIVRQMTTKVRIREAGSTGLVQGELIDLPWIERKNNQLRELKKIQGTYDPIILGISKSVLQSESFLLAASFQEVSRVLVRSALCRKTDFLRGLHENVILGQLIPAGTGLLVDKTRKFEKLQKISVSLTS